MNKRHVPFVLAILVSLFLVSACGAAPATPTPVAAVQGGAPAAALTLSGAVEKPASWSLADLKGKTLVKLDLMHPKTGKQSYEGVKLSELLSAAKPTAAAKTLTMFARDGYTYDVPLADAVKCSDCLIAIDSAGTLSAAMPNLPSAGWVRDLTKIEVK